MMKTKKYLSTLNISDSIVRLQSIGFDDGAMFIVFQWPQLLLSLAYGRLPIVITLIPDGGSKNVEVTGISGNPSNVNIRR